MSVQENTLPQQLWPWIFRSQKDLAKSALSGAPGGLISSEPGPIPLTKAQYKADPQTQQGQRDTFDVRVWLN